MLSTVLAQISKIPSAGSGDAATLDEFEVVFGNVVFILLGFAGIILFITLVMGGFKYITAGSDQKAAGSARQTITYAVLGFVLVAMALLIIRVLEFFTGVNLSEFKIAQ